MTREEAAEAIKAELERYWLSAKADLVGEDLPTFQAVSQDAVRYGLKQAQGDPSAEADLRHVAAQLSLLRAHVQIREAHRVTETLIVIAEVGGRLLGSILQKALIG